MYSYTKVLTGIEVFDVYYCYIVVNSDISVPHNGNIYIFIAIVLDETSIVVAVISR